MSTNLNELLNQIMKYFDRICFQDKERGQYADKGVEELYGVTKDDLKTIYENIPRTKREQKAKIAEDGTITLASHGGFEYRFHTRLWQYKKTTQILKQLWITRIAPKPESDDIQYWKIQDQQLWPPIYDAPTNTEWGVMFEYHVKLDDVKIAQANKIIPLILANPQEAKRVGSMLSHHFYRDNQCDQMEEFRLQSLSMHRLMEQDNKCNKVTAFFPRSTNKYLVKWSSEFCIIHSGTTWTFFAVHELDGDPYYGDYIEHLQVKCPAREIDMTIYYNVRLGD